MADFTALKATIQQYIKQNGNNEITGVLLQDILLSMVSTLGESAINDLTQALADEVTARGGADTLLSGRIDTLSGSQTALATFINSGYIFKGIATLSTNPGTINGKVFYLTVTAGQYANMGNVTANAGISVLAYDGSAWSATLLLGMDNTPVENSGNMVKSGGVHFAIAAETARALAAETSSVEFNSTTKNLIFKNSEGTVLYQLAVSTFLNSGAVYAGYATPSTNPPALTGQKVFYVATQAGTYTHFLANYDTPIILANDGIYFLVSGVDDDDWNAEIIMGVDDEPTAGSNNLVKSGGVQNELALGAVYDVSAKNPTAGPNNDGKWESLSALLSDANLNNLIPTSVRKGGMSIKFVQSSDNKYVQYQCIADEFTTDISAWISLNNFDNSDYVKNVFGASEYEDFEYGYIDSSGTVQRSSSAGTTAFYDNVISIDDKISKNIFLVSKVKCYAIGVAFYKSDNTFISRTIFDNNSSPSIETFNIANVPDGTSYVRFWYTSSISGDGVQDLEKYVPNIIVASLTDLYNEEIELKKQNQNILNIFSFTPSLIWTSGNINSDSTISPSTHNYYSNIITKEEYYSIKYAAKTAGYLVCFVVYNDDGSFRTRNEFPYASENSVRDRNIRILLFTPVENESISDVLDNFEKEYLHIPSSGNVQSNVPDRGCHISFDDYTGWEDFIINENTYTSIFDNSFLADLKNLHDAYGVKFTLNCFCTSGSYHIEDCPNKFAAEFSQNHDWLKFAFHGEDASTTYETNKVAAITESYDNFVAGIYALTGDIRCIDRVTRTSSFTGTIDNIKAIRDCGCGVVGLLTEKGWNGSVRQNYYLNSDTNTYTRTHLLMYDSERFITFIRTMFDIGMNMQTTIPSDILQPVNGNVNSFIELYLHYPVWQYSYTKNSMTLWVNFLRSNGYKFEYPMYYYRLV